MRARSPFGARVASTWLMLLTLLVAVEAGASTIAQNSAWNVTRPGSTQTYRVVAYGDSIFAGYTGATTVARRGGPHVTGEYIAALTGKTPYVFWVMMDVEPHREALFNDLYDNEHLPLLMKLPGAVNAVRYRTATPGEPRYLCAYEVERTDLPMSKAWNDTSDIGRWKPEVRPYTYNKRYIVSERIVTG